MTGMVAGRELGALDRQIAKEIFGWHEGMRWNDDPREWEHWGSDEDGSICARCPAYSTSIAAAWEVVEYMRKMDEWAFTLGTDTAGDWDATFWEGDTFHDATADTAPASICLAALKAVGALPPTSEEG